MVPILCEKFSENRKLQRKCARGLPSAFVSVTMVSEQTKKTFRKGFLSIKKLKQRAKDGSKLTNTFIVIFDL